jgi:uncharacterized membrane protein HdeD (DUF308 family)
VDERAEAKPKDLGSWRGSVWIARAVGNPNSVAGRPAGRSRRATVVIILGVILLIIGFVAAVHIIWILGIIALVIGAVFAIAGFTDHEIAGRRHWY